MAKGDFQRLANRAQEQDILRQKQIQNQINIINRLLGIIQKAKVAVYDEEPRDTILAILEGAAHEQHDRGQDGSDPDEAVGGSPGT